MNPCALVAERDEGLEEDENKMAEEHEEENDQGKNPQHQPDQIYYSESDIEELEKALLASNQIYPKSRSNFGAWRIGFLEIHDGVSRRTWSV